MNKSQECGIFYVTKFQQLCRVSPYHIEAAGQAAHQDPAPDYLHSRDLSKSST